MIINKQTYLKFVLVLSIIISTSLVAYSQNIEFEKDNFPGKKDELRKAKDALSAGEGFYKRGETFHRMALQNFLLANEFNPNNADLNYKIGICYLSSGTKNKCLSHFEKAYQLNPTIDKMIHYYLGQGYHLNAKWDKAISEYTIYKQSLKTKDENLQVANKRIAECNNGKILETKPVRVFIENIGGDVNSDYADYGPVITADESVLIFTSRRLGGTTDEFDEAINEYYEDTYVSYQFNNKWSKPTNIGPPINTKDHDAAVGLSPDGQKLITYKGDVARGNLFISEMVGTKWSKPEAFPKPINSDAHEPSASISFDGKTLYFVSDREDGSIGGHDIYVAKQNGKGKWENKVTNIGSTINTPYHEEAVFITPDGNTMYFSSQGHNSMGGYDIFKTTFENGMWTQPENLGWPINTPDDDVFFVIAANGRDAYYASSNLGGYGGTDIYKITILGPEKEPMLSTEDNLIASIAAPVSELKVAKAIEVKGPKITLLKGVITDEATKQPLEAQIELIDNFKNEILAVFTSNSATGKYLVSIPSGKNYGINVKKDGYLFHSENFDLPVDADYVEIVKNIALKKIDIGKSIVLRNIFFDFDKATLRQESTSELERLVQLLTENPTIKIELGSHTDSKGSDEYNQKLSENRSKSVVDHLISKGIAANRLTHKGYGETKPIASNETEIGRQENRRTEFKIIAK